MFSQILTKHRWNSQFHGYGSCSQNTGKNPWRFLTLFYFVNNANYVWYSEYYFSISLHYNNISNRNRIVSLNIDIENYRRMVKYRDSWLRKSLNVPGNSRLSDFSIYFTTKIFPGALPFSVFWRCILCLLAWRCMSLWHLVLRLCWCRYNRPR